MLLLSPFRPLHDGRLASWDTQTDHRESLRPEWTPTCLWAIRTACACVCDSTLRLLLQLQYTLDPVDFSPETQEPKWPNKHTLSITKSISELQQSHVFSCVFLPDRHTVCIYLGIALAEAPHRPDTHHADAQSAHCGIDVRSLLCHDEEAECRYAKTSHYQPVPIWFPFYHLCNRCRLMKLLLV